MRKILSSMMAAILIFLCTTSCCASGEEKGGATICWAVNEYNNIDHSGINDEQVSSLIMTYNFETGEYMLHDNSELLICPVAAEWSNMGAYFVSHVNTMYGKSIELFLWRDGEMSSVEKYTGISSSGDVVAYRDGKLYYYQHYLTRTENAPYPLTIYDNDSNCTIVSTWREEYSRGYETTRYVVYPWVVKKGPIYGSTSSVGPDGRVILDGRALTPEEELIIEGVDLSQGIENGRLARSTVWLDSNRILFWQDIDECESIRYEPTFKPSDPMKSKSAYPYHYIMRLMCYDFITKTCEPFLDAGGNAIELKDIDDSNSMMTLYPEHNLLLMPTTERNATEIYDYRIYGSRREKILAIHLDTGEIETIYEAGITEIDYDVIWEYIDKMGYVHFDTNMQSFSEPVKDPYENLSADEINAYEKIISPP